MMKVRTIRLFTVLLILTAVVAGLVPQSAQASFKPEILVNATWHPDLQLTSLDGSYNGGGNWNANRPDGIWDEGPDGMWWTDDDDDIRYVEAQIMVTTNVQFWAVEMECAVNDSVLEGYYDLDQTGSPFEHHDDRPMIEVSPVWWGEGGDYAFHYPQDSNGVPQGFNDTGKLSFAISRVAPSTPLGWNGETQTFLLASLNFRVKNQGDPFSGNSPIKCKPTFLDRDGNQVTRAKFKATSKLMVQSGYVIQGNVAYQARKGADGIGVQCGTNWNGAGYDTMYHALSDKRGNFKFTNIRELNHYDCYFFSNITDPAAGQQPDLYMSTSANFNLDRHGSFTILPVMLHGGDLNLNGGIHWDDMTVLTANWGKAAGDVNGDAKADEEDMAIVAGNFNWHDGFMEWHVLYGLSRQWGTMFDSRIWRGGFEAGAVVQQLKDAKDSQFHWPALSPDGAQIAHVLSNGASVPADRTYELVVSDAYSSKGKPVLQYKDIELNAFAPSWSPDGTRIAFVTSWGDNYLDNNVQLAVVDADGQNYRPLEVNTEVFPPAWLQNDTLAYACDEGICLYDLRSGETWRWSTEIPTNARMPVLMNNSLFYLAEVGGGPPPRDTVLRYAELDYSFGFPPAVAAYQEHPATAPGHTPGTYYDRTGILVHTDVIYWDDTDPNPANWTYGYMGDDEMDYFDVNWYGNNLMFTTYSDSYVFWNAYFNWEVYNDGFGAGGYCGTGECWPEWRAPYWHEVDNQPANPFWDGDPSSNSYIHALRHAIDYVP